MTKTLDVVTGFETWLGVREWLKRNKIKSYRVEQGIKQVKVENHVIIVPPKLERIISELLKEL